MYDNTNEILPAVYQKIMKFMKNKKPADELFDKVQPDDLNDYFKSVMPGLSAKVTTPQRNPSEPPSLTQLG